MPDADGAMSAEELRSFLDVTHLAIMTTNGANGVPHSTPVLYRAENDGAISVIVLKDAIKLRNPARIRWCR